MAEFGAEVSVFRLVICLMRRTRRGETIGAAYSAVSAELGVSREKVVEAYLSMFLPRLRGKIV